MGAYVAICSVTILIIWVINRVHRWRNPKCNGRLPPGSMGFPLLGETLHFFKPNTSSDIPPFVKERVQRYNITYYNVYI